MAVPFYIDDYQVFARWRKNCAIENLKFVNEKLDASVIQKHEVELYSQVLVSAMYLYRLTHEQTYLNWAAQYAQIVMDCQQRERSSDWAIPLHGFFYESREKNLPVMESIYK